MTRSKQVSICNISVVCRNLQVYYSDGLSAFLPRSPSPGGSRVPDAQENVPREDSTQDDTESESIQRSRVVDVIPSIDYGGSDLPSLPEMPSYTPSPSELIASLSFPVVETTRKPRRLDVYAPAKPTTPEYVLPPDESNPDLPELP